MSFEELLFYLTTKHALVIYAAVAFGAFVENLFPPFPSDVLVLVGAYLAGRGDVHYIPLFLMVTSGGFLGAMLVYYLGRTKGRRFFERYDRSYLRLENLRRIERWFDRWGSAVLLLSRFLAGVRAVVALAAGLGNVPALRMTVFTLIGFCLWYAILIAGMYFVKTRWHSMVDIVETYTALTLIITAVLITIWLVVVYSRSMAKK